MASELWARAGESPCHLLFRVHHADSGTIRSAGDGFRTQNCDWLRDEEEFYDALEDHLDFYNDEHTPFISVSDSATSAANRARWMKEQGYRNVRIAVIDPSAVGNRALNVRRAAAYLGLHIKARVFPYTAGELVYLRHIPEDAVDREYSNLGHFCRAFGGSRGTREFGTS